MTLTPLAAALRSARIKLLAAFAASERLVGWEAQLKARRAANLAYRAEVAQLTGQPHDHHGRPLADVFPQRAGAVCYQDGEYRPELVAGGAP